MRPLQRIARLRTARAAPIHPPVDILAATIELPVTSLAATIEAGVDAVALRIETRGSDFVPRGGGPARGTIETSVRAVAASVEMILDPVAPMIETPLDAVATIVGIRERRCTAYQEPKACDQYGPFHRHPP